MSALNSTDPLILQTALTNLMTVAHVELAIDKIFSVPWTKG
jgi:hypothetical protein